MLTYFLTNSTSIAKATSSPIAGTYLVKPNSERLMVVVAENHYALLPHISLPAPLNTTSKVTGLVTPPKG